MNENYFRRIDAIEFTVKHDDGKYSTNLQEADIILVGLSRKSLIGKVLNNQPSERLIGTIVLNTISILNGANIIRVHDVKEHKEMMKLLDFLATNHTN